MYNDNQKEEYIKLITEHLANIKDEKFLRRIYISVRDYVKCAEGGQKEHDGL